MLSRFKLLANRSNSQLSTVSRSDAGKSVAASNACNTISPLRKSQLRAKTSRSSVSCFTNHRRLSPRSSVESALVEQIADAECELLRIAR